MPPDTRSAWHAPAWVFPPVAASGTRRTLTDTLTGLIKNAYEEPPNIREFLVLFERSEPAFPCRLPARRQLGLTGVRVARGWRVACSDGWRSNCSPAAAVGMTRQARHTNSPIGVARCLGHTNSRTCAPSMTVRPPLTANTTLCDAMRPRKGPAGGKAAVASPALRCTMSVWLAEVQAGSMTAARGAFVAFGGRVSSSFGSQLTPREATNPAPRRTPVFCGLTAPGWPVPRPGRVGGLRERTGGAGRPSVPRVRSQLLPAAGCHCC